MEILGEAKDELAVNDNDIAVLPLSIELDRGDTKVRIVFLDALKICLLSVHL
jgi:hypothetical protein